MKNHMVIFEDISYNLVLYKNTKEHNYFLKALEDIDLITDDLKGLELYIINKMKCWIDCDAISDVEINEIISNIHNLLGYDC